MTILTDLIQDWEERIRQDLAPFGDPGTSIDVTADGRTIRATWTMRNEQYDAAFSVSLESGVVVRWNGEDVGYSSFFAGPDMADLRGLAKMILQASPRALYVDTPAVSADKPDTAPEPATQLLHRILNDAKDLAATGILMVTGDAGAGKTSVLQEAVRQSAEAFLGGRSQRVLLYVNAQGRALARLDEALATELSDLRARLTYHAVPTLTRLGLVVPVIDGFDELLGVSGYDEAFSSLSRFVEDLDGQGQIIASARSTYYEQEFIARANSVSALGAQVWQQFPIRVLEWGAQEVDDYLRARIQQEDAESEAAEIQRSFDRAFSGENAHLRTKPFFVARVASLVLEGEEFTETDHLLASLVRAYADREVGKLKGRSGEPLLNRGQVIGLLQEIAEEMWNEESRELSRQSARDVAEFVLGTQDESETTTRYVIERMPTMAFLAAGARFGHVTFEHESFFAYFLGTRMAERLTSEPIRIHTLLGRSPMPQGVADAAASRASAAGSARELQHLLGLLSQAACIESTRQLQVRENAGLLAASVLRTWCRSHEALDGGGLRGVTIPGSDMHGVVLREFDFIDVEFRRVDLSDTRFIGCKFVRGLLQDVTVNPQSTKLEFVDFDPSSQLFGLRVFIGDSARSVYDPAQVNAALIACGMDYLTPPEEVRTYDVPVGVVDIVERVAKAYQRTNPISVNEDEPRLSVVWRRPEWQRIERLLTESGVVQTELRGARGTRKTFLRRQVRPEEILAGMDPKAVVPPAVRRFWEALAGSFGSSQT